MKILIIDNDPAMTEMLTLFLHQTAAVIDIAKDAAEGIQLVKECSPDLIILDLVKPDTQNWEVCSAIRSLTKVPIIVLSANDHPGMVARSLNAGADDYLVKPINGNILLACINKLMRRINIENGLNFRVV
ncbi:MAG: response regulator transcription factor [Anaerolineaceae bacterium]|jgi:two-component system copper resistance phosphate regulon response regulator CusR